MFWRQISNLHSEKLQSACHTKEILISKNSFTAGNIRTSRTPMKIKVLFQISFTITNALNSSIANLRNYIFCILFYRHLDTRQVLGLIWKPARTLQESHSVQ